jgi:hypothetical protein
MVQGVKMVDKINFITYNKYNTNSSNKYNTNSRSKKKQLLRISKNSSEPEKDNDNESGNTIKVFKITYWKIKFEKE